MSAPPRPPLSAEPGDGGTTDTGTTLTLDGELDVDDIEWLDARLRELTSSGDRHLTVDLGGVTFMDSAVLMTLLRAAKDIRHGGGWMRIVNAQGLPMRLLTLVREDDVDWTVERGKRPSSPSGTTRSGP